MLLGFTVQCIYKHFTWDCFRVKTVMNVFSLYYSKENILKCDVRNFDSFKVFSFTTPCLLSQFKPWLYMKMSWLQNCPVTYRPWYNPIKTTVVQPIDFLYTRPDITQCTGRITEKEIYSQFGFPMVELLIQSSHSTNTELGQQHVH